MSAQRRCGICRWFLDCMCFYHDRSSSSEGSPTPPPPPGPPLPPPPWAAEEEIELANLPKPPSPAPKETEEPAPDVPAPKAPARDTSILFPERGLLPARDPYYPLEWFENRGRQLHEWMRDPDAAGCPIEQSTLTWEQILAHEDCVPRTKRELDLKTTSQHLELATSYEQSYPDAPEEFVTNVTVAFSGNSHMAGQFTRRAIEMISIQHQTEPVRPGGPTPYHPHISEMVVAGYNAQYGDGSIVGLRDISAVAVHNAQTIRALTMVYAERFPVLYDDPASREYNQARTFDEGTPEFYQIMGTRIGRTISSIVLAGFPRGTRSITRIWTYFSVAVGFAEIRFQLRDTTGA
ncbi:uncharacterized protein N7483_000245 [Penicillium malachiteum]|uniref:uncharacterized protein n=1 Tax=Penicillium malachiteum TaxID=1324776 RepID=UPI0025480526|nr:uncharacterized protein N7483_000245 [Penicillium malachiteum]KAJ5735120.1 hypothetical protein N7483_000245 [Penicillium malachiteum]